MHDGALRKVRVIIVQFVATMPRAYTCLPVRGGWELPSACAQYTIEGMRGKDKSSRDLKRGEMRQAFNYDTRQNGHDTTVLVRPWISYIGMQRGHWPETFSR